MINVKPYFETELGKLYHGDCLEIMPLINEKIDMVLTDPPYGINLDTDYKKLYGTGKKHERIINDQTPFDFKVFKDLEIKEQFWFGAERYINLPNTTGGWLVWYKYYPDQKERFAGDFDLIWSKQKHRYTVIKIKGINVNWQTAKEFVGHPTQKPIELMKYFIIKYTKIRNIVVDPYVGSGTTAVACEQLNRRWIGIEISKEYCDIAVNRLRQIGKTKKEYIDKSLDVIKGELFEQ